MPNSSFAFAKHDSGLRRILAVTLLGLPLIVASGPVSASVKVQPSEFWQFIGTDEAQELRAELQAGELNATVAFVREQRQWFITLQYPDGDAPGSTVSLSATYDADAARNRPHRVEQLSLSAEPDESAAAQERQALKLALPHTFIIHLQGADRLELDGGGRKVVIPLHGSAKAIAMIYAALGEARGTEGRTMTDLVNKLGSAPPASASKEEKADVASVETVETIAEASASDDAPPQEAVSVPSESMPRNECELSDEIPVEEFGECLRKHVAALDDYLKKTGKEVFFNKVVMIYSADDIVLQVSKYIKQKYPHRPNLTCYDLDMPHDISYNRESAIRFVNEEMECLREHRLGIAERFREKYYSALEYIPVDYYGKYLEEKLSGIINEEEDRNSEFVKALEPRYREHFELRKAHGLM